MKTIADMLHEIQQEKASVSIYMHTSGDISITVQMEKDYRKAFEMTDLYKDGLEDAVQKMYNKYMRITNASPELVPHRLPPPASYTVVSDSDDLTETVGQEYTEYTEVGEQKKDDDEVPF